MTDPNIVRCIDDLHATESGSMLQRLHESAAFVTWDQFASAKLISAMINEEQDHLHMLVDLLDQLGTTPAPRRVDVATGNLHFNKPAVLIPRLIANKDQLIAACEQAGPQVAALPTAAATVARILANHRAHRVRLTELQQSVTAG